MMYFTGWRDPEVWAELGIIGNSLSFTTDDTITKLGIGYIKSNDAECAMDTAVRFTLLNAGENGEISAKQMLNHHTRMAALVEEGIVADGWHKVKNQEGNLVTKRAWVYAEGFPVLFKNRVSSSYSYNNAHFPAYYLGSTSVSFSEYSGTLRNYNGESQYNPNGKGLVTYPLQGNERMLSNLLDDKTVLRAINKSLNRMTKSGKAIQVTAGRGRTFRWNAWGWLESYRQKHLTTLAKQRKLGDKVNGWEFTKGKVTNMYGVEICDHEWRPVEEVYRYNVVLKIPHRANSYGGAYYERVDWTTQKLPYSFLNKDEAQTYANSLVLDTAHNRSIIRINNKPVTPTFEVTSTKIDLRVEGSEMIEDYLSPTAMYERMLYGNLEMFTELNDKLVNSIYRVTVNKMQKEE